MPDEALLLKNQICFRVYSLERAIMAAYKPLLGELGLTYPQYLVMLVLWERTEATVGQLCESLGLDTGTISPLLKRMEQHDLVIRERLPSDERTVIVRLTNAGSSLRENARRIPGAIGSCIAGTDRSFDEEFFLHLRETLDHALAMLAHTTSCRLGNT